MLSKIKIPRIHTCHTKDVKTIKHTIKPRVIVPQPIEKKVNFDLEITEFEVRVAMSASVMLFSMGMLVTRRGDPGMYLPLITSIIGYWTPSPAKKKD
jgi:hypothetical protein